MGPSAGQGNGDGPSLTLDKAEQGPRLRGLPSHPCSEPAHGGPTDTHALRDVTRQHG